MRFVFPARSFIGQARFAIILFYFGAGSWPALSDGLLGHRFNSSSLVGSVDSHGSGPTRPEGLIIRTEAVFDRPADGKLACGTRAADMDAFCISARGAVIQRTVI